MLGMAIREFASSLHREEIDEIQRFSNIGAVANAGAGAVEIDPPGGNSDDDVGVGEENRTPGITLATPAIVDFAVTGRVMDVIIAGQATALGDAPGRGPTTHQIRLNGC